MNSICSIWSVVASGRPCTKSTRLGGKLAAGPTGPRACGFSRGSRDGTWDEERCCGRVWACCPEGCCGCCAWAERALMSMQGQGGHSRPLVLMLAHAEVGRARENCAHGRAWAGKIAQDGACLSHPFTKEKRKQRRWSRKCAAWRIASTPSTHRCSCPRCRCRRLWRCSPLALAYQLICGGWTGRCGVWWGDAMGTVLSCACYVLRAVFSTRQQPGPHPPPHPFPPAHPVPPRSSPPASSCPACRSP